ncbi:ArdC family protein [Algicola sagamiensis]|uniref:ArdC family protein n=1 Tax=Algicola sagamiensis TaxID=163869 RepID=UPI0003632CB9|nr:zincin-like metallopeptidase domain-containing protein [Algicola sagamiensis]
MKTNTQPDIQQIVTDSIIALIEEKGLMPWQCPWQNDQVPSLPYNWSTKAQYSGVNVLMLWMRTMESGYKKNAWLTFNQAKKLGGRIIKGEKATSCIFVKPIEVDEEENGEIIQKTVYCRKFFSVFNLDQIEGLKDIPSTVVSPQHDKSELTDAINMIANQYCEQTGVKVKHGGSVAVYSPASDLIRLPTSFRDESSFVSTFAHELIHSTGIKSRLDRFKYPRTKEDYAKEELCAELGAAFFCAELGIQGEHHQHASYINDWLGVLKNDKSFIFNASSAAYKAYTYIKSGGICK